MTDAARTPRPRGSLFFAVFVAAVGAALLLACGTMTAIYTLRLDAAPIRAVAAIVPIPAARVDGSLIRYAEWIEDTRAFLALAESGRGSIPGARTRDEIGQSVMARLIRNRILERIAADRGITVSDAEVDAELAAAASDDAGRRALADLLQGLGWSERELKEKVLRPAVVARRLADRLGSVAAAEAAVEEALGRASVQVYVRY
jgi:hypothetical protein